MGRRFSPLDPELRRLAEDQCGLLTVPQCRAHGLDSRSLRRRLETGGWSAPASGLLDTDPRRERTIAEAERRQVEAAMLLAGAGSIAVGLAALSLHGCWALPRRWRARAARERHTRGRAGSQHRVFEAVLVGDRAAAGVPWAIVQALPRLDRIHLVGVLDWALHEGHIRSVDEVLTVGAGRRGIRRLRDWSVLADARAESFFETWARLQCIDAGVPPTTLQLELRDAAGRVRARGDLAWKLPDGRWLVVEIDGAAVHDRPVTIRTDRRRQNWMVGAGEVTVLRYDVEDLVTGVLPGEVRTTIARMTARPAA